MPCGRQQGGTPARGAQYVLCFVHGMVCVSRSWQGCTLRVLCFLFCDVLSLQATASSFFAVTAHLPCMASMCNHTSLWVCMVSDQHPLTVKTVASNYWMLRAQT